MSHHALGFFGGMVASGGTLERGRRIPAAGEGRGGLLIIPCVPEPAFPEALKHSRRMLWWVVMSGGIQGGDASLEISGGEDIGALRKRIKAAEGERDAFAGYLKAEKAKREAERAGRIRAETALRKALAAANSLTTAEDQIDADRHEQGTQQQAHNKQEGSLIPIREIGLLQSCYRRRFGTPRQGAVVKGGRAILRILDAHNPKLSTENLGEFSHVWLIYLFHENTNVGRQMRPGASAVKSKVAPPRLDGRKVGLYSTRTPHRPNAMGLSLVKLDKVEGGVIYLSGIDLVNGTPILDVKPYIPSADSVPFEDAIVPSWITSDAPVSPNSAVVIQPDASSSLQALVSRRKLEFYDTYDDVWGAISEVLSCDIRSKNMRDGGGDGDPQLCFDNLIIDFQIEDAVATVTSVRHSSEAARGRGGDEEPL